MLKFSFCLVTKSYRQHHLVCMENNWETHTHTHKAHKDLYTSAQSETDEICLPQPGRRRHWSLSCHYLQRGTLPSNFSSPCYPVICSNEGQSLQGPHRVPLKALASDKTGHRWAIRKELNFPLPLTSDRLPQYLEVSAYDLVWFLCGLV